MESEVKVKPDGIRGESETYLLWSNNSIQGACVMNVLDSVVDSLLDLNGPVCNSNSSLVSTTNRDELFLNLVMEYVPETLFRVFKHYSNLNQRMLLIYVKLYMYQIFRGLAYIQNVPGVCHRDVKPQNLLVDPLTHQIKLCDFGSAKVLVKGEANISYICSRYYRAPEHLFGATEYTTSIGIWSAGCVLAELLLGQPLFPGENAVDQLVEIIMVLGDS